MFFWLKQNQKIGWKTNKSVPTYQIWEKKTYNREPRSEILLRGWASFHNKSLLHEFQYKVNGKKEKFKMKYELYSRLDNMHVPPSKLIENAKNKATLELQILNFMLCSVHSD